MALLVKRVYEKPAREDGTRVLVDRLWPRGLTKEAAAVDVWLRELAPSNELRKWYHQNAKRGRFSGAGIRVSWKTPKRHAQFDSFAN